MGAVYRAFHLRVHKVFALKMLLGDIARHRSIASRFQLEAQAAGRIGHPGILDVYDVGEDTDGTPFIVMELLRGEPLSALVHRQPLEVEPALWVAMEILDVLEAAHKAGIIHRDVKPQNVFLTEAPSGARGVKLLDFGIAKFAQSIEASALTRSGEIIGSPLYMAPEQAKGEPDVDARVDVWSVGAMLFEMLTGQCAHAATTPVAVLAKILTEPAPPPSSRTPGVGAELDAVVQKALTIDRAERWPTAKTMRDALAVLRTSEGVPALPAPVKISVPPNSGDRTPAAITSTIAAASTPPPSGFAETEPARAFEPKTRAETPRARDERKRSPLIMAAAVAVVIGAGIYVVKQGSSNTSAPPAESATGAGSPSVTPSATPVSAVPMLDAAPAPLTSEMVAELHVASSDPHAMPSVGASASKPAASARSASSVSSAPRCAAREHLSLGHCCELGLEWQNNHCERPIATQF
jgi:serine/threonine-protein kinase